MSIASNQDFDGYFPRWPLCYIVQIVSMYRGVDQNFTCGEMKATRFGCGGTIGGEPVCFPWSNEHNMSAYDCATQCMPEDGFRFSCDQTSLTSDGVVCMHNGEGDTLSYSECQATCKRKPSFFEEILNSALV